MTHITMTNNEYTELINLRNSMHAQNQSAMGSMNERLNKVCEEVAQIRGGLKLLGLLLAVFQVALEFLFHFMHH